MNHTLTIFLKELKETLREKRTLISMILVPLLIYPLLFVIVSEVTQSQTEKSMEKTVKIGMVNGEQSQRLHEDFELDSKFELKNLPDSVMAANIAPSAGNDSMIYHLVRSEDYDVVIWVDENFQTSLDSNQPGKMWFYYNSTSNDIIQNRVEQRLKAYEDMIVEQRFAKMNIARSVTDGMIIEKQNVATDKEILGKMIGGFLPYLFIIIAFTGSMYPALDLAAGEKERGTIETILTTPASKSQIVMGKIFVVMLAGLISAVISVLGILLSLQFIDAIPGALMDTVYSIIEPQSILLLLVMMIPLTFLFANILLSLSIYARSFKEAQSMVTPMIVLVIFPAIFGMLPGIELDAVTALIPILNISLITKEIMAGTLNYLYFAEAIGSMLLLSTVAFVFSLYWFGRENVVLR